MDEIELASWIFSFVGTAILEVLEAMGSEGSTVHYLFP
jgi:hypothetical protein